MKKLLLVGLLLASSTGCGRGWLSNLFGGASCGPYCNAPAPMVDPCQGCGGQAGYAGFGDGGTMVDGGYLGGFPMGGGVISSGPEAIAPSMGTLPGAAGTPTLPGLRP
jgi:hypothetical protein